MTAHLDAAGIMAAQCLCFRARRVSHALTRLYDEALRPMGIHATQLTLMNAIALIGAGDDGAPMSRVAEVLALDVTTVSRNVRTLEKSELVTIERSASDRRVRLVTLTPEGERKLAEALPAWRKAQERVIEVIGSELAAELRDGFDAMVEAARRTEEEEA